MTRYVVNISGAVMLALNAACSGVVASEIVAPQDPELPSGLTAQFVEVITKDDSLLRLRYVVPQIADQDEVGFDDVEPDFKSICEQTLALNPTIARQSQSDILVSFSSEPVLFGDSAPNVVQYFEQFSIQNGLCMLEVF